MLKYFVPEGIIDIIQPYVVLILLNLKGKDLHEQ